MLTLTLVEAQEGLELGLFTSETLVSAFLAQIDAYEQAINAFTFRNPGALDAVRCSTARSCCCRPGNLLNCTALACAHMTFLSNAALAAQ